MRNTGDAEALPNDTSKDCVASLGALKKVISTNYGEMFRRESFFGIIEFCKIPYNGLELVCDDNRSRPENVMKNVDPAVSNYREKLARYKACQLSKELSSVPGRPPMPTFSKGLHTYFRGLT